MGTPAVLTRIRVAYRQSSGEKFCPWCQIWKKAVAFSGDTKCCDVCKSKRKRRAA